MPDAVLEISTSIAQYQAEMAKVPGVTDRMAAQAAIAFVKRSQTGATKASKAYAGIGDAYSGALAKMSATDALAASNRQIAILDKNAAKLGKTQDGVASSSNKMSRGFSAVAMQAPDLWTQIAGGADPMVALQQQGLQVVQQMGDVGGQLKSVAGFMVGPWGLAVAGAATAAAVIANAWHAATDESRNLEESIRQAQAELDPALVEAAAKAWDKFAGAMQGAREESLLTAGEISSEQMATSKKIEQMRESASLKLRETAQGYAKLEMERQLLQAQYDRNEQNFEEQNATKARLLQLREELPLEKAKLAALRETIAGGVEYVNQLGDVKEQANLTKDAEDELADRRRDAARARREQERAAAEESNALAAAQRMGRQSASDLFDKESQLTLALAEQVAALEELQKGYEEGSQVFISAEAAKALAASHTQREIDAVRDAETAAIMAERDKLDADLAERAAQNAALEERYRAAHIKGASSMAGSLGQIAESMAGESKEAQLKAFRFAQVADASQVGLNTILAVSEASTIAPPPFNAIPMAAAALQGVAMEAAIWAAPPPAYTGIDVPYASPMGSPVMVHPGERVTDRTESDAWRRSQREQPAPPPTLLDGRDLARSWARNSRRGGVAAKEQSARGGRIGQRSYP